MRAGKILLLIAVLTLGAALQTALAVRDHISIGPFGCRVLGGRFAGPSFTFEASTAVDVPPGTALRVDNAFGAVKVRAGEAGRVRVGLRKVVFVRGEARARELADQVRLSASLQGQELRVRTNRDELARGLLRDVGLETHLDVEVPAGTPVTVASEHGPVEVADAASARVQASFDAVRLERVAGEASVKARHGDVSVAGVGGALTLEARHGDVEVRDAGARVELDVQHGDVLLLGAGGADVQLRHGDLKAERLGGGLRVRGEHARVEAAGVAGTADIETSYRDVTLRSVQGDVRVVGQHGGVHAEDVGGALYVRTAFDDVELARVGGPVDVGVEHGGVRAEQLERGATVHASGDAVSLDGFRGPLNVEARRGDVTLTPAGPLGDPLAARVEHGGLTLVVPAGSRGSLDAQAERGEVQVDDLPGLRTTRDGVQRAEGLLGGGGPAITLRTQHGDIRLEGRPAAASTERE